MPLWMSLHFVNFHTIASIFVNLFATDATLTHFFEHKNWRFWILEIGCLLVILIIYIFHELSVFWAHICNDSTKMTPIQWKENIYKTNVLIKHRRLPKEHFCSFALYNIPDFQTLTTSCTNDSSHHASHELGLHRSLFLFIFSPCHLHFISDDSARAVRCLSCQEVMHSLCETPKSLQSPFNFYGI